MTEFGVKLLNDIGGSFSRKLRSDRRLKALGRKIRDGTDYTLANDYAVRAGELLSSAIDENTKTLSYMSEEVAREVLTPLLTSDHELITEATKKIQSNMNEAAGIGLEVLTPDLDTNRIEGLIYKVSSYQTFDEARWVLGEPVINYSMAIVDQAIRKNFERTSKAGLAAKIVRETEASESVTRFRKIKGRSYKYTYEVPCDWCQSLAGTYDYDDVSDRGNDVFRRHEGCRCKITYVQGKRAVDVRTKAEWTYGDTKARQQAIQQKVDEKASQEAEKARWRVARERAVERIQRELGYSERGASIFVNAHKAEIQTKGLDRVIEETRFTNPYARQA